MHRFSWLCVFLGGFLAVSLTSFAQEAEEKKKDWIVLFDGKSLDAWKPYQGDKIGDQWTVDDGALHLKTGGGGDIITKEKFKDFELEFEWKVAPGANSGVMYRVRPGDPAPYYSGPEYQILDDKKHPDGRNPMTSAASLYALVAARDKELKPVGEYNRGKIVIRGDHLEHWLNGEKVLEIEIGSDEWDELVSESKFREWEAFGTTEEGHIALQDHGDPVWFRNIRIRRLSPEQASRKSCE